MNKFPSLSQRGFVMPTRLKASAYDAGGGGGGRGKSWKVSGAGPNAAATQNLALMRSRARAAIRNDPWAKAAIHRLVTNTIGTGIQPHPKHSDEVIRAAQKSLWSDWLPDSDADGLLDFYGQQTLAARAYFSDGEVLARRRFRPLSEGLAVPMQVQVLEADMLPTDKNEVLANGSEIISGVEYDADGRRTAYHFLRRHPGEYNRMGAGVGLTVRVPADEVAHVFQPLRPGQVRGVPELSTVLLRLHSLDNFDDAVLFRQEVSNLFAGFITKPSAPASGPPVDGLTGAPVEFDADGFSPVVSLEPGSMSELGPGEEVTFAEPPGAGTDYAPFMRQQLMSAAASVGMPYEVLTGDLRDVSDRVLRVLLNEFRRGIEQVQWNLFIHQFCRVVWRWWVDAAALAGSMAMPGFYTQRREYMRANWVPQGWPYIHPVQDVTANQMAVRSGFTSRSAVVLKGGDAPEVVEEEVEADNRRADARGLRFDTDLRWQKPPDRNLQSNEGNDDEKS